MSDGDADTDRALSFGTVAEEYDRWRTAYPAEAVDWLAPLAPARVADVGAGTGKLTALLVDRGLTVDAVEPDPRMLAVLKRNIPDAQAHQSESTRIPAEDRSLDAVLVADAWHWFDPQQTMTELRRVLRPGGWLGLLWNVSADPVEPWETAMAGGTAQEGPGAAPRSDGVRDIFWYFPNDEFEIRRFRWAWEETPESHAARWATTSMAIALDARTRTAKVEAKRREFQQLCDDAGRRSRTVNSIASCIRWTPAPPS